MSLSRLFFFVPPKIDCDTLMYMHRTYIQNTLNTCEVNAVKNTHRMQTIGNIKIDGVKFKNLKGKNSKIKNKFKSKRNKIQKF